MQVPRIFKHRGVRITRDFLLPLDGRNSTVMIEKERKRGRKKEIEMPTIESTDLKAETSKVASLKFQTVSLENCSISKRLLEVRHLLRSEKQHGGRYDIG